MRRTTVATVCGILLAGSLLYGQEFRATLTGRVLDPAGAPVANAKVRVTNAGTNEVREAITDSQGNYLVPLLNPGIYSVKAEAAGFKTAVQEGLQLAVNQTATLDLQLQLGSMATQVTVTAETPLLEDANADRGGLVDEAEICCTTLRMRTAFAASLRSVSNRPRSVRLVRRSTFVIRTAPAGL